jgi:hypothetical protein
MACTSLNCKAPTGAFFDKGMDGLNCHWLNRAWCNPPFSEKEKWIKKAHEEVSSGRCPVCVMILPLNSISRKEFHDYVEPYYKYDILKGRVSFLNNGVPINGNNTGTAVVYFMRKPEVMAGAK